MLAASLLLTVVFLARFQTPSKRGGTVLNGFYEGRTHTVFEFQTPSKRGGTVLHRPYGFAYTDSGWWFQTPSKRGGTVLTNDTGFEKDEAEGFKPLQNGAVRC